MGNWEYYNPVRVWSGRNHLTALPIILPRGNILLLSSKGTTIRGTNAKIIAVLGAERVTINDSTCANPDLDALDDLISSLQEQTFSAIVAVGGGSVIDSAKVLGVCLAKDEERPLDRILRGGVKQNWGQGIPVFAIPTTSGTGAEVTPFATVWDFRDKKKFSVFGDAVFPSQALLDPSLLVSLPMELTLFTGLDAISHALESLWNKNRTPVSSSFALAALDKSVESFPRVLSNPDDLLMRAEMQDAAVLGGFAISQGRTALAHSISYPLTLHHHMPHGLACSFTLTALLRIPGIKEGLPEHSLALCLKTADMLDSLGIPNFVSRYANLDEMLRLIPEMSTKARSDNFSLDVSHELIADVLHSATKDKR